MVLLEFFNWVFELPSFASGTLPTPIQNSKDAGWYYSTIICLIVGAVFILFSCIYGFTVEAVKCTGRFATPQFPAILSYKKKKIKRCGRKSKKSSQMRLTKAQRLQEVNKKWSALYCSDNSDCEELEDIATVPFGSLEITEVKKVSFRETIEDVYFIESKEEMKRLEELQSMGYDVTIKSPNPSTRDRACKKATEAAVFEEKETVLAPGVCSTFDNYSDKIALKKLVDVKNSQMGDAKKGSYENRIFKDEERLLEIPLLHESTV